MKYLGNGGVLLALYHINKHEMVEIQEVPFAKEKELQFLEKQI